MISITEYNEQLADNEKTFEMQVKQCKRQEGRSFKVVTVTEYITLSLLVVGMAMLVGLAWKNF